MCWMFWLQYSNFKVGFESRIWHLTCSLFIFTSSTFSLIMFKIRQRNTQIHQWGISGMDNSRYHRPSLFRDPDENLSTAKKLFADRGTKVNLKIVIEFSVVQMLDNNWSVVGLWIDVYWLWFCRNLGFQLASWSLFLFQQSGHFVFVTNLQGRFSAYYIHFVTCLVASKASFNTKR